jgi:RNA polymerase sigma-70 factor (ECF subfamily)
MAGSGMIIGRMAIDRGSEAGSVLAELPAHREALHRFALLQVRDAAVAEDLVQATLLAAVQSIGGYRGESSLRTWLIGILKRKIIDYLRERSRDPVLVTDAATAAGAASDEEFIDRLFLADGHWATPPANWGDPHRTLEQDGFWLIFETCVQSVPGIAGRVFLLRELAGLEPEEICKDLALSKSNYWVLMHRARLRLRDCLDKRWFAGQR